MQDQRRQLVAILFTDIVGYTALMQQNEMQAVSIVKQYISILTKKVAEHGGKILNDYGDGSLCSFSSATHALTCAIEIQHRNLPLQHSLTSRNHFMLAGLRLIKEVMGCDQIQA